MTKTTKITRTTTWEIPEHLLDTVEEMERNGAFDDDDGDEAEYEEAAELDGDDDDDDDLDDED